MKSKRSPKPRPNSQLPKHTSVDQTIVVPSWITAPEIEPGRLAIIPHPWGGDKLTDSI